MEIPNFHLFNDKTLFDDLFKFYAMPLEFLKDVN